MRLYNLFYDSKTKTGALLVFSSGKICFIKTVPDLRQGILRDPKAGILDGNKDFLTLQQGFHVNDGMIRTEFYRIVDEIIKNLLDLFLICMDRKAWLVKKKRKTDSTGIAPAFKGFQGLPDNFIDIKIAHLHQIAVVIKGIQCEKAFCELFQTFCFGKDDVQVAVLHFHRDRSVQNGFHIAFDGSERGTEIVRNVGNELSLVFASFSGLSGENLETGTEIFQLIGRFFDEPVIQISGGIFSGGIDEPVQRTADKKPEAENQDQRKTQDRKKNKVGNIQDGITFPFDL